MANLLAKVKDINPAAFNGRNLFYSAMLSGYLEVKIANYVRTTEDISVLVQQGNKVVVQYLATGVQVADVVQQADNSILLSNLRWYNEGQHGVVTKSLGRLEGIKYKGTAGQDVVGDIELVAVQGGQSYVRVMSELDKAFINGYTKESILAIPKGSRPSPSTYLKSDYIANHLGKFQQQGGAFIIRKRDIIGNPNYQTMAPRKFLGLKSEMDNVIQQYHQANDDVEIRVNELDLGNTYFKPDDEVYFIIVKGDKGFSFEIPNGNEGGAYDGYWVPGGRTKHGTAEAVISNSGNYTHGNNWSTFVSFFGVENVVKIK